LKGKIDILKQLITKIENYPLFEKQVNQEFATLAENISQINFNSDIAFSGMSTIYFDELAEAIISILGKDSD